MAEKDSDQSPAPTENQDHSQSQNRGTNQPTQGTGAAQEILPARNPQRVIDHALPERNPEVTLKTIKETSHKGDMEE